MNLESFLDPENKDYQIKVIAPTHTYGTVYGVDSRYDFEVDYDEYDTVDDWEYIVMVNGEILSTFNHINDAQNFINNFI